MKWFLQLQEKSFQFPLFHHFVNGAFGAEDALEKDYFANFLMDVGFLLDGLDNFLEILLFAEVFDASEGEMRHEVLSIALIANIIESG